MNCSFKNGTPAQGGGGSTDSEGGAGGSPEDASDAASVYLAGAWVDITGNLEAKKSDCGNLTALFEKPNSDVILAGVFLQGLWASTGSSPDWTQLGTGAGSEDITNGAQTVVFDPENTDRFWESGLYGSNYGVYGTTDGGKTFANLNIGYSSDVVAVDFSDPNRKVLYASGHERPQFVSRSTNGGATWANIAAGLPAPVDNVAFQCTEFVILDPNTYLVGCGVSGGLNAIYRTTDGAKHWIKVSDGGGTARPILAKDGSIYWMTAANGQLLRSTDLGATWVEMFPPNVLSPISPIELPDGRLVAVGPTSLVISANQGRLWDYVSPRLPHADTKGVLYSAKRKAFFIWRNDCGGEVLPDAVMRFDFDYKTQ